MEKDNFHQYELCACMLETFYSRSSCSVGLLAGTSSSGTSYLKSSVTGVNWPVLMTYIVRYFFELLLLLFETDIHKRKVWDRLPLLIELLQ